MRETRNDMNKEIRIRQIVEMLKGIKSESVINRIYFFVQRLFKKESL